MPSAIAAQAVASLRSLVPNVSYDAPTTVKLGPPGEFPDGLKFLPDERLFVFREGNVVPRDLRGLHAPRLHGARRGAVAARDAGRSEGTPLRLTHRFLCPCHGSKYTGDGTTSSGPAPRPLAWYHLVARARRRPARGGPGARGRPRLPPDACREERMA